MQLSELVLFVAHHSRIAIDEYSRRAFVPCGDSLSFIANKIAKELPNIELPSSESSESQRPAGEDGG